MLRTRPFYEDVSSEKTFLPTDEHRLGGNADASGIIFGQLLKNFCGTLCRPTLSVDL